MTITDSERARAVAYLRETKVRVIDETAVLTIEQWRFKPSPSGWSASECIEHLTLVETGMLRTVQAMRNAPGAPADVLAQLADKDDLLVRMIRSRKRKVQAPPQAHPSRATSATESADPAAVLDRFCRIRDHTIEYLETTSDPLRSRVHPHFILGPFDGYQWILFLGAHTERHLGQIRETMEYAGHPPQRKS